MMTLQLLDISKQMASSTKYVTLNFKTKDIDLTLRTLIADYLLPESEATLEEKFDIFSLWTEMNDLPHNFGKSDPCKNGCQEDMSNFHIFSCRNPERNEVDKLNYGNVKEKVEALRIFQKNLTNFFVEEI